MEADTTRKSFSERSLFDTAVKSGSVNYDVCLFAHRMPKSAEGMKAKQEALRDMTGEFRRNYVTYEYLLMQILQADRFLPEDARLALLSSEPVRHEKTALKAESLREEDRRWKRWLEDYKQAERLKRECLIAKKEREEKLYNDRKALAKQEVALAKQELTR